MKQIDHTTTDNKSVLWPHMVRISALSSSKIVLLYGIKQELNPWCTDVLKFLPEYGPTELCSEYKLLLHTQTEAGRPHSSGLGANRLRGGSELTLPWVRNDQLEYGSTYGSGDGSAGVRIVWTLNTLHLVIIWIYI